MQCIFSGSGCHFIIRTTDEDLLSESLQCDPYSFLRINAFTALKIPNFLFSFYTLYLSMLPKTHVMYFLFIVGFVRAWSKNEIHTYIHTYIHT